MPKFDPVVKLRLVDRGREWSRFKNYEITSDYFTSTDGFNFSVYSEDQSEIAGWELEPVEIAIDGAVQLIGRIERSEIGGDDSSITYSGRDYISDLVECNVDPTVSIKKDETLFGAITRTACPVGIDTVLDDDEANVRDVRSGRKVGPREYTRFKVTKAKDYKPEPGEGIYEFLNKMVAREGATIQPGNSRNELVLSAPNFAQDPSGFIRVSKDPSLAARNNAYHCKAARDYSRMPTFALFQGRGAENGKAHSKLSSEISIVHVAGILSNAFYFETGWNLAMRVGHNRRKPAPGTIFPSTLYRMLFFRDNEARNQEMLERAIRRAISDRIRDSLVYTCTVKGHKDPETQSVYAIDTMIDVQDDIRRVHEKMWVASRTFKYTEAGGAETDLTLLREGVILL